MPESLRVKIKNLHFKGVFNTAQKERLLNALDKAEKAGRWDTEDPEYIYHCSKCWFQIDAEGCIDPVKYINTYKYCPNCGDKKAEVVGNDKQGKI